MAGSVQGRQSRSFFDRDALKELWQGLIVMTRVSRAIVMRESRTRYGTSDLGYAWAIIDPMIELSVLLAIFTLFGRLSPLPVPLSVFLITGIMPYHFFKDCMSRGSRAVSSNSALLTYPQVKVSSVIIGRVLLEAATSFITYICFIIALRLVLGVSTEYWFDNLAEMIGAMFAIFWVGLSAAFFSSSMTRLTPVWDSIWSFMARPLWFMSGIFYSLSTLPHNARRFMIYNPIAHMIEWWRSASIPMFESTAYSMTFVVGFGAVLMLIGLLIDRLLALVGHTDVTY